MRVVYKNNRFINFISTHHLIFIASLLALAIADHHGDSDDFYVDIFGNEKSSIPPDETTVQSEVTSVSIANITSGLTANASGLPPANATQEEEVTSSTIAPQLGEVFNRKKKDDEMRRKMRRQRKRARAFMRQQSAYQHGIEPVGHHQTTVGIVPIGQQTPQVVQEYPLSARVEDEERKKEEIYMVEDSTISSPILESLKKEYVTTEPVTVRFISRIQRALDNAKGSKGVEAREMDSDTYINIFGRNLVPNEEDIAEDVSSSTASGGFVKAVTGQMTHQVKNGNQSEQKDYVDRALDGVIIVMLFVVMIGMLPMVWRIRLLLFLLRCTGASRFGCTTRVIIQLMNILASRSSGFPEQRTRMTTPGGECQRDEMELGGLIFRERSEETASHQGQRGDYIVQDVE